nr:myomodulin, MMC=peptide cotransmitter [Aplysia californica=mollusk, B16 accessory radula closer (ARC) muscle, Peptide, 7 aa] [Aplysia californica]
GWSMLRL